MTKKVNAEEFNKKPGPVFRAADKGETVIINHDRYEKVFELTARDREPLKETELVQISKDTYAGSGALGFIKDNQDKFNKKGSDDE